MTLPRQNSAWVDGDGRPTRDLYNWARSINVTPQTEGASSYALGDLSNVRLSGISDGDVLTWSDTQGRWVNSAPSGGGGSSAWGGITGTLSDQTDLQAALNAKQDTLSSGANIKTVNGNSLLGSGDLSVGGYSEGASFPSSPAAGDKFYRTDLNWLCFYDGTRWLTANEYDLSLPQRNDSISTSAELVCRAQFRTDYGIYITRWGASSRVISTNTGTAYWTVALITQNAAATLSTVTSFTTASDAPDVIVSKDISLNAAIASTEKTLVVRVTKTGSPGNIIAPSALYYRLIVT